MKRNLLLLILVFLISCQNENTAKLTEKGMEYFQNGKFDKALEINKKLIKKNLDSYYYFAQRALILEISENDKEAQNYYSKAREKFYLKEESYWKKYDSTNMAMMLMEIGDSTRSRKILKLVIKNRTSDFPENELFKLLKQTHGDILEIVKLGITSEKVKVKNIIDDRN